MSNHKNLLFFNKEGDSLNVKYNEGTDRFESDLIFHENSSDTFKTLGLYILENVPSFEYESPGQLTANKFQLFNEYGIHFYGSKYTKQQVTNIVAINNDPQFYSKWIYGDDFESKFPVGSVIRFDSEIMEFNNTNRSYVVVSSKKGAIMIISQMDNATFESSYLQISLFSTFFDNLTISGVNSIGVYDYISDSFSNNLSKWNEPNFYDRYYNKRKLNIVNSNYNDGVVTVNDVNLTDLVHFEYYLNKSDLSVGSDIILELNTRTDLPNIFQGSLNIKSSDNKIVITDLFNYPHILKPGREFKIVGSVNNNNFLTVASMPEWKFIYNETFFATQSQVIYNNRIYQCVQAYTQSFGSFSSSIINPNDQNYWSAFPDYIKVEQSLVDEDILFGQLYLTTDKLYFSSGWTYSSEVTLASFAEKYAADFKSFNIDLYYKNNTLKADLMYASKYAVVNFYQSQIGAPYLIGNTRDTLEKIVGVQENLTYELNYDYSENYRHNIVFTDIDEFGIKIIINKQVYEEEVSFIYTGFVVDMERTIDRTLRNWLKRNYIGLYRLGITAELRYTGSFTSIFYNSIQFKTEYPNVPLIIDDVEVGVTANYYIEHSTVLFTGSGSPSTIGSNLRININDKDYDQVTENDYVNIGGTTYSVSNIPNTLSSWVSKYSDELLEYGIIVTNLNNILKFDIKRLDRRLDYMVSTGKVNPPGLTDFKITKKFSGNLGSLITSNEIALSKYSGDSFEDLGFATGMVVSINNTVYPYNNQEYNIQFLDPKAMNISYQGPFWSLSQSICNSSAFVNLAFTLGFGETDCVIPVAPTGGTGGGGGEFDSVMFNPNMFSLVYNTNVYNTNLYQLASYPGSGGFVDMLYIQLANSVCTFGDNFISVDSYTGNYISTVFLLGNTQSLEMKFNPVNNYVYCLSKQQINIVDPVINALIANISLTASGNYNAFDIEINPLNGDVYVSFLDWNRINIYSFNNLTSSPTSFLSTSTTNFPPLVTRTGAMVFNDFEGDMYITTDANYVLRVNSNRTIQTVYGIPGLTHSIFYEPVLESVYVYGSSSLWRIDNGITQSISIGNFGFSDIIYNNLTGEMNISDQSTSFTRLNLFDGTKQQTGVANYGYIVLNQFDGDVYLSSQAFNTIVVIKPTTGIAIQTVPLDAKTTKIIYNPDKKAVWALQPSTSIFVEIEVEMNNVIEITAPTFSQYSDFQYGALDKNYKPRPDVWLKTREYVRRPRENFEGDVPVKYYFKWLSDNVPEIFMYDFSGDQLPTTGPYSYTGPKPLTNAILIKTPNKDKTRRSIPQYQQTIFDKVEWQLSYIDDEDDLTTEVEPFQLFAGFNSQEEGVLRSVLQLYKKEEISFDITADINTNVRLETILLNGVTVGQISINESSTQIFTGRGLKRDHPIVIYVKDVTNSANQYTSNNNALLCRIRDVYTKRIIVDFYNGAVDYLEFENTIVSDYPKSGQTTYLKFTLKVKDREIGRFTTYGQTEIEDIRYKIELGNVGKLISPDEVFIFKEYDILEGGIDWSFLNKKRKEMLMNKHLIYPFIGAYKSIINAINYFGYNDLQLNEYFRNIDPASKNFLKLFKIEIPDIFDNTISGWNEKPFAKMDLSNGKYEETKMFNLAYNITNFEGERVINYSIDEIVIKLQGLKYWLKKNIVPLTHKIMDITGKTYFSGGSQIQHKVCDVKILNMKQEMTPVTFKLNEAYLIPVNSGSTVYNCVLDFYSIIPGIGASYSLNPLENGPKAYNSAILESPEYFNISIRTYKTYKEWAPYVNYNLGDKVIYYDKLYESQIINNKAKNPRKYSSVTTWSSRLSYQTTNLVEYKRDYYVFSGLGSTQSSLSPNLDSLNWLKVTEWKQIDKEPVQIINEFRKGDNLLPFNFTVDSNIDPFLVIEVTCDNGYGCVYKQKKNYEIRGIKDLQEPYRGIDPIGPFQPIPPVY